MLFAKYDADYPCSWTMKLLLSILSGEGHCHTLLRIFYAGILGAENKNWICAARIYRILYPAVAFRRYFMSDFVYKRPKWVLNDAYF